MKKLTESTTVVTALKRREWGLILQCFNIQWQKNSEDGGGVCTMM
jgi:hypothetical protein